MAEVGTVVQSGWLLDRCGGEGPLEAVGRTEHGAVRCGLRGGNLAEVRVGSHLLRIVASVGDESCDRQRRGRRCVGWRCCVSEGVVLRCLLRRVSDHT